MAANYAYRPGVCNIGPGEVRKRAVGGWLGLSVAVVLFALGARLGLPRPWRALLFLPLVFSAIGFVQARAKT